MKTSLKCTVGVLTVSAIWLSGCQRHEPGPAERAGRNLDQAAQAARKAVGDTAAKAEQAIGDTAITSKIKASLLAESGLKGMQIQVETNNGMVKLMGKVGSQAASDKAAAIAKGVDGVKSVDNQLTVDSGGD